MNWVRGIAAMLVLWSSTARGAILTWNANSESDLAGYRVYHCGGLPCTPKSGASLLDTLGKATSLIIGTPAGSSTTSLRPMIRPIVSRARATSRSSYQSDLRRRRLQAACASIL
jgi:hypothetical protein